MQCIITHVPLVHHTVYTQVQRIFTLLTASYIVVMLMSRPYKVAYHELTNVAYIH